MDTMFSGEFVNENMRICEYPFMNDNNDNGNSTIIFVQSREPDKVIPDFLVLHLHNEENYQNMFELMKQICFSLCMSDRIITRLPLSLLIALNEPRLDENKLYIKLPFEILMEPISLIKLAYQELIYCIYNTNELVNYVSNYSIVCKTYSYHSPLNRTIDVIQDVSQIFKQFNSLYINLPTTVLPSVSIGSLSFSQNVGLFNGLTKGFFIEGDIDNLSEFTFIVNDIQQISYNRFYIANYCSRVSNTLIYIPTSPNNPLYESFEFNGAINCNLLQTRCINLTFSTPQTRVGIHNLCMNKLNYSRGICQPEYQVGCNFGIVTTPINNTYHFSNNDNFVTNNNNNNNENRRMEQRIFPQSVMDNINRNNRTNIVRRIELLDNYVRVLNDENEVIYDMYGNIVAINDTVRNLQNSLRTILSATTLSELPSDLPSGLIIHKKIDIKTDNFCPINHAIIRENDSYMECNFCNKNFSDSSIKMWLRVHATNDRNCPCCRTRWSNYNVYINSGGKRRF